MTFADPELLNPSVHCFARCHWCKNLVPILKNEGELVFGERQCPKCGVELSETRLRESFSEHFLHTSAITSANKFVSFDLAVIPFMIVSILITYMEYPIWIRAINLVAYHTPIVLCVRWLKAYWFDIRFEDEEYLEAVSRIKKLLILWSAANLLNWGFIVVQWYLE